MFVARMLQPHTHQSCVCCVSVTATRVDAAFETRLELFCEVHEKKTKPKPRLRREAELRKCGAA